MRYQFTAKGNPEGGEADEFIVGCFAAEFACRKMFIWV